jgi:cation:H+ antiporter
MTPVLAALAAVLGGIALIVAGAEAFFRGLLAMARHLRVSAFFLTVLISGFELENVAAGLAASLAGFPGAAAGTFLGGTTFIALAVAGAGAIIAPLRAAPPASFLAVTAASGVPVAVLARDGKLSRVDGLLLIAAFALAMALLFRSTGAWLVANDDDDDPPPRFPLAWLVAGLAAMTIGGELLSQGLQSALIRLGLSPTLLGNTAIAALTEAEEVARVAVPTRRGRPEVAAANIGGTALHFLTLNAGLLAVVRPLPLDEATMRLHLPVAVAAPIVFAATLAARGGIGRLGGVMLIALYASYIGASIAFALGRGWW